MLYETAEDRQVESSVARKLGDAWNVEVWSFVPQVTTGDLLLGRDGVLKAICEVKRRYNPIGAYPTYIISRAKLERVALLARITKSKGLIVIQFDDALAWYNAEEALDYPSSIGGRYDRQDPNDVEQMTHIPIDDLNPVAYCDRRDEIEYRNDCNDWFAELLVGDN